MIENNFPDYMVDDYFLNENELDSLIESIDLLPVVLNESIGAADDGVFGIPGSNFLDRSVLVSEADPEDISHPLLPIAEYLIDKFCKKHNFKMLELYRTRVNRTPLSKDPRPLIPHVDLRNKYRHYILLIFLNDSDGDTIMYDLKVDGKIHEESDLIPLKRFSPKAGRAVLFDGDYFHAWEHPQHHDYRISMIANISIEKIEQ